MDQSVVEAFEAGDNETVRSSLRYLLHRGEIDVHARSKNGATYLIFASYLRDVELLELLLQAGSEVDARAHDDHSSLVLATLQGETELARALIQAGADVNLIDKRGASVLYMAADKGYADVVDMLLEAGAAKTVNHCVPVTMKSEMTMMSPLMMASGPGKGNVQIVQALIKAGADVTYKNSESMTALSSAASCKNVAIAKALLSAGALANLEEARGPLLVATTIAHLEMIHALVEGGADVNMHLEEGGGATLLQLVCSYNEDPYVEVLKTLAALGAAIDGVGSVKGVTPLMTACWRGSDGQVKVLLEAGADVTLKDNCGRDALGYALQNRRTQAARLLVEALRGRGGGGGAAADDDGDAKLKLSGLAIGATDEGAVMKLKKVKECMNCGKKGEQIKMCSGCQRVALCPAECLKAVWPTHKAMCKNWSKEKKEKEKAGGEHGGREGGERELSQPDAKNMSMGDGKHAAEDGGEEEEDKKKEGNHEDSK